MTAPSTRLRVPSMSMFGGASKIIERSFKMIFCEALDTSYAIRST